MKPRDTRYGKVVSLSSDSSPGPACARAFLRGMYASGASTRDLFSWTSSQPGHLHQSGQTTSLSRVVLATWACRQLTSRDYILARIRPGEVSPGYMEYDTRLNLLNRHEKRSEKKDCGKDTPRALLKDEC